MVLRNFYSIVAAVDNGQEIRPAHVRAECGGTKAADSPAQHRGRSLTGVSHLKRV